jgi:hypothetical protein
VRVDTEAELMEQRQPDEPETKQDESVIDAKTCLTKAEVEELSEMAKGKKLDPSRVAAAYGKKTLADVPSELYLEVKGRIQRAGNAK